MSEQSYAWKGRFPAPVKADVAAAEIERVRAESGGFVAPVSLVDASRPDDAPLHPAFEWDDAKAAGAYRVDQAGQIIRSIVVIHPEKPREEFQRAYVSVTPVDEDEPRYTRLSTAMSVPDLREQVLSSALRDMQAFEMKYRHLTELALVIEAMQKVRRSPGPDQASRPAA